MVIAAGVGAPVGEPVGVAAAYVYYYWMDGAYFITNNRLGFLGLRG